jgi:pimeloyl-ACP methyl ester carboxylesterase
VLLHGFPDNLHLYDQLVPQLPGRRVVRFDFLGWGASDKPAGYPHSAHDQTAELAAVIDDLGSPAVVLVAHDASGPPAIDWALGRPDRVELLVLLNTYYGWCPTLRPPEVIALFSTPPFRGVARWIARRSPGFRRALYFWQVGRFVRDDALRRTVVPRLYQDFPDAVEAFFRLNNNLWPTIVSRSRRWRDVAAYPGRVRVVFGSRDPYLNPGVARYFARSFPRSELTLVPSAGHFVQIDAPVLVAERILARQAQQDAQGS